NAHYEATPLPQDLDYTTLGGLSSEAQQKLNQHKPETAGQAARISGITPATISLLLVHAKRGFFSQKKKANESGDTTC
ncbi:MAG: tRNA uridine-5-carboxymethylaminomethyl(34) synthesis enzyme MnmG, partial [Nitrosospira sp.]